MTHRPPRPPQPDFWHDAAIGLAVTFVVMLLSFLGQALAAPDPADAKLRHACRQPAQLDRTRCIIRLVFGANGEAAINVAWCESRLNHRASNGQYLGLFQMGAAERARYGHGRTVLAQARAAQRYYRDAGWRPWTCKPGR